MSLRSHHFLGRIDSLRGDSQTVLLPVVDAPGGDLDNCGYGANA